jgi:hypothetical protein
LVARRVVEGTFQQVEQSVIDVIDDTVGAASLVLHGNHAPGRRMLTDASG